jgi:phosphoglycerate dehydrogenase-like enzyme
LAFPVLVLCRDAEAYADLLRARGMEVLVASDPESLPETLPGVEIVLGEPGLLAGDRPVLPDLRWVQSTWAGVAPLLRLARDGVVVTGVKGVFGEQMAEYVLGHLLSRELRVLERDRWQRRRQWNPSPSGRLAGKTLGVLGTGDIGREVARRAQALDLRIVGCNRSGRVRDPFATVYPVARLHEFLAGLDYLVVLLPRTPETDRLLDGRALACLPAHAVLVNAGRGTCIDEAALLVALREERLAGAVLDVFETEPLPADHPLWTAPNTLITAHVAALSEPRQIVRLFLENHRRFCAGESLQHRLDPVRGY